MDDFRRPKSEVSINYSWYSLNTGTSLRIYLAIDAVVETAVAAAVCVNGRAVHATLTAREDRSYQLDEIDTQSQLCSYVVIKYLASAE